MRRWDSLQPAPRSLGGGVTPLLPAELRQRRPAALGGPSLTMCPLLISTTRSAMRDISVYA